MGSTSSVRQAVDSAGAGRPALELQPGDRWLRRIRMMVVEQHERPVWSDAREIVDLLQAANANAIRWPSIVWAATFFDSAWLPKHPAAAGRDFVQELLDAVAGAGISVIPYVHLGVMYRETFARHPEWAVRDGQGVPRRWNHLHYNSCLANPGVIAAYAGAVGELVARFPVPAVYIDGPVWYGECACVHCQAAYRAEWDLPLPESPSWSDGSRRNYNELRFRQVVSAMATLEAAIAGAAPDRHIPAMFNTGMLHNHSRRNGSVPERVMAHAEGCLSTEVHRRAPDEVKDQGGSFLGIMESVRLGVSLQRTALCYTPPGPYESLVTYDTLDTPLFGAGYLALGGTPIIETARSFLYDRTGLPAVRKLFDYMERHASLFYEAQPLRRVAVLYSRQTAEHHTGDDIAMTYERHFSGMLQALTHDHQSFVCLYDWHLCAEELVGVDALVLPNAACLSDAQLDIIREFVVGGGGLAATADTSLYDEHGGRRDDFGLGDLFGLRWTGHAPPGDYGELQYREGDGYREIPEAYMRIAAADHPIMHGLTADQLIPVSDAWWVGANARPVPDYVRTELASGIAPDATVIADLFLPAGGEYGTPFRFPLGQPPGVVVNTVGAGRVVYIGAGVSQHYQRRGLPALRRLLNNAVDWAAGTLRPVRVDAPLTVLAHLTSYRGDSSEPSGVLLPGATSALLLHLVNYTGNMHEASGYRVEYVAPVPPIAVTFEIPPATVVVGVTCLGGRDRLSYERDRSRLTMTISDLGTHETILVHLADGAE